LPITSPTTDADFFELRVGHQVEVLVHREEDSPLDRLQPVAHVGQGPRRDDREGVIQVSAGGASSGRAISASKARACWPPPGVRRFTILPSVPDAGKGSFTGRTSGTSSACSAPREAPREVRDLVLVGLVPAVVLLAELPEVAAVRLVLAPDTEREIRFRSVSIPMTLTSTFIPGANVFEAGVSRGSPVSEFGMSPVRPASRRTKTPNVATFSTSP